MIMNNVRTRFLLAAAAPLLALSAACAAMPAAKDGASVTEAEDDPDEAQSAQSCGPFDKDWHFLAGCLRAIRDSWSRSRGEQRLAWARTARATVDEALANDRTGFARGPRLIDKRSAIEDYLKAGKGGQGASALLIYQKNQLGQPYNGMGQSGMAYYLAQFAQLAARTPGAEADANYFRSTAEGILQTALAPTGNGGLTSKAPCHADIRRECAWFHSITRRDRPAGFGVTLNQSLHVLRDLGAISDIYDRNGWPKPFDFDSYIAAGLNQLFVERARRTSGDLPTMADYLTPPVGTQRVRWLYYGFNRERPGGAGGYFLGRRGKDCGYQVHVLDLAQQVLKRAGKQGFWDTRTALSCNGALAQAWRGTEIRMTEDNPDAWSDAGFPKDTTCNPKHVNSYRRISTYYTGAFASCGF